MNDCCETESQKMMGMAKSLSGGWKSNVEHSRHWRIALFLFLLGSPHWAWGEPVTTIRNNGDPSNRVDLVILGDGYTASELAKYTTDVENAVNGFFSAEPFKEYKNYFNVHRVDVISNESGADHPELGIFKDTAFDATYNCSGIQRLLCVEVSKVNTVLTNSLGPNQRDVVLVIVNDAEYGGSGGAIAVASTNIAVIELVLHESGHSFGLLADEYTTSPPPCNNAVEPPEPNVTKETVRNLIKWNVGGGPPTGWIDFSTPVPTTSTTPALPGLYQGAKYCVSGLYRPTFNSKMRELDFPFEQINEEQLVKRIYNLVSPLDSSEPIDTNLTLPKGQSQVFRVTIPHPLTHSLETRWFVDSQPQGTGLEFILDSTGVDPGVHTVEVVITDPTSKVRNDPFHVLTERRSWTVDITIGKDNNPPVCRMAQPIPASLWPPNHTLVPVRIGGVADPDNDQVTITITRITQDEPVNGKGDGDTSPDAELKGSTVLLRAERAGSGNGRIYQITFTASDRRGDSCTGSVKVQVPQRMRGPAIDDGQRYNSLLP